jgi:tRNA-specific 2-thiouridylase
VKFGAFVEYLEREHGGSFDRIASGHYACIQRPQQQQQQQAAVHHDAADNQLQERLLSNAQASSSSSSVETDSSTTSSSSSSSVVLRLTPDAVKDQTYFLANLSAGQLARCMFPLGPFTKPQVRLHDATVLCVITDSPAAVHLPAGALLVPTGALYQATGTALSSTTWLHCLASVSGSQNCDEASSNNHC